jgi:hypothetical protein
VDTKKVSSGEMIAGISALALFIFMFLPWYGIDAVGGVEVGGFGIDTDVNAWQAFSFIDLLLFIVSIVVVGLVLAKAAEASPDLPAPPATAIATLGGVAVVLILFRLIFAPDGTGDVDIDVDVGRKIGIFLGLIAAGGITYGGWRAMQEVGPVEAPRASTPPPAPSTPPEPASPPPAQQTPPPAAPPAASPPSAPPADPPASAPPGGDRPPYGGQQ